MNKSVAELLNLRFQFEQITENFNHGVTLFSNKVTTVLIYINYQYATSLLIEEKNTNQFFE